QRSGAVRPSYTINGQGRFGPPTESTVGRGSALPRTAATAHVPPRRVDRHARVEQRDARQQRRPPAREPVRAQHRQGAAGQPPPRRLTRLASATSSISAPAIAARPPAVASVSRRSSTQPPAAAATRDRGFLTRPNG